MIPQRGEPELRHPVHPLLLAFRLVFLYLGDPTTFLFIVILVVRVSFLTRLNLSVGRLGFTGDDGEAAVVEG